jgi:hypothetical protein
MKIARVRCPWDWFNFFYGYCVFIIQRQLDKDRYALEFSFREIFLGRILNMLKSSTFLRSFPADLSFPVGLDFAERRGELGRNDGRGRLDDLFQCHFG